MSIKARIQAGDGDSRHGSLNGYRNLRCRCDLCRRTHSAHVRARRTRYAEERKAAFADGRPFVVPQIRHGNGGYANYSCRCQVCRDAHAEALRYYRARAS